MKTDERLTERIAHLESDIKLLKNEVQAVLVDLREQYLTASTAFAAPSVSESTTQQVVVLEAPAAAPVKSDAESAGGEEKKEEEDKIEKTKAALEAAKEAAEETANKEEKDKTEEPRAIVSDAGKKKPQVTAREEVSEEQEQEQAPVSAGPGKAQIHSREINLLTIGGLVSWAEESVKRLGHQRTEAILDVAELTGLLTPELRQIMTKLIDIDSDRNSQSVSAKVFLNSLVKVTTLLGKDNQTESALLSILSEENDIWIR